MPRIAFFDTFSGISGDMTLGAILDAGLSLEELRGGLGGLKLGGFKLEAEKVMRGAFQATRARVVVEGGGQEAPRQGAHHRPEHGHHHQHERGGQHHEHRHAEKAHSHPGGGHPHRHLPDILEILEQSTLPAPVRTQARAVFERLAQAEARIHGVAVEAVHFHEVGAVDSIVDITGACLGLHLLGVEEVWFSRATVGTGTVKSAHGEIPLPAPATLELLRSIPLAQRESGYELTTPTGAALSAVLARGFGPMPPLAPSAIGYGAGDDRPGALPNVLRLVVGEGAAAPGTDRVVLLETTVDDMSPQWIGYLVDRLLEAGALDVAVAPVQMKKSRPAHEIRVLAPLGGDEPLARLLFRESTTFGIRRLEVDRLVLERTFETVATPWGPVRIKVGSRGGEALSAAPEYEDLRRIAGSAGVPLREVHRRALEEFHRRGGA